MADLAACHDLPVYPTDDRLAAAPRRVPASFLLAELLPSRGWYLWAMFMVVVALIALWAAAPLAFSITAVAVLVVVYADQLRGAYQRLALLKWGEVATVTDADALTRGTYYSGTTWDNAYLPVASGWTVQRPRYSGPSIKTKVSYRLGDYRGAIVIGGREYTDGVVLADPRKPSRALCVTTFAYDLDRDEAGNWIGRLRPRLRVDVIVWLMVMIGWLTLAGVVAAAASRIDGPPTATQDHGVDVVGNNKMGTYGCDGGDIDVVGNDNSVTVTGHCRKVRVSGDDNVLTLDTAESIRASGDHNVVTYRTGSPAVTNFDDSNSVIKKG